MKAHRYQILAVLAVIMHVMVQITPLWMPLIGAGEGGQTIQICTSQGIETVTFDENGVPVEAPTTPKHDCPFCLAQTTSPLSADIAHTGAVFEFRDEKPARPNTGITLPPSHFSDAYYKRGPPTLS